MSRNANIPRLFSSYDTVFTTQGLGALTDAISANVREELNGEYELTMEYPLAGIHFGDIAARSIIVAKPNPVSDPVPFRVYSITKPLNGRCTIRARHLSYDLSGHVCPPVSATGPSGALTAITNAAIPAIPFTFSTTLSGSGAFSRTVPSSVRSCMGGSEGSLIDTFGGEWLYDYNGNPYQIRLTQRGADNGVTIKYGKNLTQLTQEENIASVYTGVYPFWTDVDGNVMTLPEGVVAVAGSFDFDRILPLDLTGDFDEQPSESQLRDAANAYITANSIGTPAVSLSVNFALLGQTDQYKTAVLLEDVELGDTVTVEFEKLGVSAKSRVIATEYDPLTGRFRSVKLGHARSNIADTIASATHSITQMSTTVSNPIVSAINRVTEKITGNLGGYVVMRDTNDDGIPEELLIMDDPDINAATKVWRWNQSGLGYSSTGYNGPYGLAMTSDGEIVADYITTGLMNAERITMGARSGDDLTNYLDVGLDSNNKIVITLGAADNQILLKLQNDRISFYDTQENELAYFSDNAFRIESLQSFELQGLRISVLANGAYAFGPTT